MEVNVQGCIHSNICLKLFWVESEYPSSIKIAFNSIDALAHCIILEC